MPIEGTPVEQSANHLSKESSITAIPLLDQVIVVVLLHAGPAVLSTTSLYINLCRLL